MFSFNSVRENSTQTSPISSEDSDLFYGMFISYIVMGLLLIVFNTPILVNILRHSVLRAKKEYLLFAGLACADMLAGWGTLIAGAYRLNFIEMHKENEQVSWWHCVGTPMFILLTFSMTVQAGMLLVISVDRFIAVTLPLKYVTFTRRYSICIMSSCYSLAAIYTALLMVYAYFVTETKTPVHAVCFVGEVNGLFNSIYYVRLSMSTLSVLVYAIVWCLFRRYQNITVTAFPTFKTHLQKTQRRLTTTVGICGLFTLIFYVIPTILMFTEPDVAIWSQIYWQLNCLNAVVNVFVYSLRHQDIRQGLKMLFMCKELPMQSAQCLHSESTHSFSVTAKAAMIVMEPLGVVASNPMFLEDPSELNENY